MAFTKFVVFKTLITVTMAVIQELFPYPVAFLFNLIKFIIFLALNCSLFQRELDSQIPDLITNA